MNENRQVPADPVPIDPSTQPEPAIRYGWVRAITIIPVWFVFVIVMGIAGVIISGTTDPEQMMHLMESPAGILIQFLQLLGFVIPVLLFRKLIDRRSIASLGFRIDGQIFGHFLLGSLAGIILISIVFGVIYLGGGITITGIAWPGQTFWMMTASMFLVGVSEETAIRGYLLNNCMASFNKYVALLVTSLLFSASHLLNPNPSPLGMVNIVLAGLLLGIYYVHRQNLWFPIGLHWTWNLFQGAFYGSQVSGVEVNSFFTIETSGVDLWTGGLFGFEASLVTTIVFIAATIVLHLSLRPPAEDPSPFSKKI